MNIEAFAIKWFLFYFCLLGIFLMSAGIYLLFSKKRAAKYLSDVADHKQPPKLIIQVLKYLFLFTLPGFILSLLSALWIELVFSLWSLLIIYAAGKQLLNWPQGRKLIKAKKQKLSRAIQRCGAIMIAVSFATFLLAIMLIRGL